MAKNAKIRIRLRRTEHCKPADVAAVSPKIAVQIAVSYAAADAETTTEKPLVCPGMMSFAAMSDRHSSEFCVLVSSVVRRDPVAGRRDR